MNRDRLWGLTWVAIVGAVVVFGTLLGIAPKVAEASAAARELTNVKAQNTQHELALATLKDEFAHIDVLKNNLAELQLGIPLTADIPAFVAQLDAIAAEHQVTLDQISISDGTGYVPIEPVAAPEAAAASTDAATADLAGADSAPTMSPRLSPANYISVPVSIEASGTNASVLDFLSGLQYGDRIIAIKTFSTGAGASAGEATVTIAAEIYVLVDPTAPAAE
ncbi:hypothetical protein SAMN05216368_102402 [Cryobacterium flavum]|uniref:Tfp pilus assembly protein PilO n=1 Tax=Cryobacterium flavum TaxID=1424659 RepID=A0A4R8VC75_9MICO|nr:MULTISPECIES: hypothetical protein [Cryobacterium]TFB80914.1 hypothetical protein E3O21_03310 [Cryobacterium flavum]SDM85691.1 hypothetical protein SAMN05216368_102402 [Cryobacterium flavum]